MSQDGYWQPVVRCKTSDCVDGNPIYLPHPDLPETTEPQPNWPAENWHPLLVCKYCGRGYRYYAKDVELVSTHHYTGLPDNDLNASTRTALCPTRLRTSRKSIFGLRRT